MNEAVQNALTKANLKLAENKQSQRDALALYFNIYTRDYAPDGKYTEKYCYYDTRDKELKYFQRLPQPLTDEEATALSAMRVELEAAQQGIEPEKVDQSEANRNTTTGNAYQAIGVLLIAAAVLAAFVIGTSNSMFGYASTAVAITVFVSGVLSAMGFFAIGKALLLLQEIANNTHK